MEQASSLLRETALPVAEIAARVGYDSQSKFSSAFKAFSGMLPTEYRKSRRPEVSQSGNNNEMRL